MDTNAIVEITPAFRGVITPLELLSTEGTLLFVTDKKSIQMGGCVFQVLFQNFLFILSIQNNSIVIRRNLTTSILTLDDVLDENKIMISAMWSHCRLVLLCCSGSKEKTAEVPTIPSVPPAQLITWARKHNLIPVHGYKTEEEFRQRIHESLATVNQKIREADAYKSFWNVEYDGHKIIDRQPKKEVEIHPLIHCFLSDQMLLGNIEIIPEYKTGEGSLDFLFIGHVDGLGLRKICLEFKLAHSADLDNGLRYQLPKYMDISNATYGIYCVLNFKGDWFDRPQLEEGQRLDVLLDRIRFGSTNPVHANIRCYVFDLWKPATASK